MAKKASKSGSKSAGSKSGGSKGSASKRDNGGQASGAPASPPELIVVTTQEAGLRASAGRFESLAGAPTAMLATLLADTRSALRPLFGPTEERVMAASRDAAASADSEMGPAEDLSLFYTVDAPPDRLESIRSDLESDDLVAGAYLKPGAEPPVLNDMTPAPEEAPPASPDFTARQGYLDAAPGGVEARWAWTQAGGKGTGRKIIDIEGEWRFTHEDLIVNQGGMVAGNPANDLGWRNHGTAVVGEFGGDVNGFGVTGISPDANVRAISIFGPGSAGAINDAANRLGPGDVLLIELHRPGPRHNFASRNDQRGYIAIEWWPDDFAAIRNAANRGIIVVEAAGNGAENLDDAIYQNPGPGFPAGWTNPFRRTNRDSGAIVVGAGAPPPGTHGRNHGADRSRLDFSNFGALVDAQGWGREVTTCAYGDLQGGTNENLWYTDTFSGTSSASPIIVGVAASLQGMAQARGKPFLTPAKFRACLRSTGSPQQNEPGRPATQRIGNRPNLRQLVTCAFPKIGKEIKEKDFKDAAKDVIKEREKSLVKDAKDAIKEVKEKELKEKDIKDVKEKELKEPKEIKEVKEREKNPKEHIKELEKNPREKNPKELDKNPKELEKNPIEKNPKELVEKNVVEGGIQERFVPPGDAGGLEQRLAAVEAAVGGLLHFIGGELRPDLSASALGGDAQDLAAGDAQAKHDKDMKDSESY